MQSEVRKTFLRPWESRKAVIMRNKFGKCIAAGGRAEWSLGGHTYLEILQAALKAKAAVEG